MRGTGFVTAAAFVLATSVGMYAQAKPDFSGSWVMDPAVAAAPAGAPAGGGGGGRGGGRGGGAGFGPQFTAKQDAKMLTIERTQGDATVSAMYMLDGSESKNTVAGRGGQTEQVSKATWDGDKLVIVTTINAGGNNIEQRRVLSMDGGNLVIEQTAPGRGGGEPTTTRLVYKKG
jgi:Spy/CpxP family protein refolding chaperone